MREPLRFHLDEHVPPIVAVALRRRGIDVTTSVDVGLRTADDRTQLTYAAQSMRVIVTHDADFLRLHAQGVRHAGIAYCRMGSRTIGQLIETLRLMHQVFTTDDMFDQVEYL